MTVVTAQSELEQNVLTNVTKELKKTADYYVLEHVTLINVEVQELEMCGLSEHDTPQH